MTKFASFKKVHTKVVIVKRNDRERSRMIWDFSIIQQKDALTCPGLYRLTFQSFYYTSLILPNRALEGIINFRNFRKLFIEVYFQYQMKCSA